MCIFSISSKNGGNCVEDAGVADRSMYIWGLGATEQKTGLTAYRFARDSLSENMLRDVTCLTRLLHFGD